MARLFPVVDPSSIENPGERVVAKALVEQLPRRVEVFHSFSWLSKSHKGTLMEGECDFVLLDPDRGMLYVEVKGGSLVFDGQEWIRVVGNQRRNLNKDPFSQAQHAMHEIGQIVERRFPGGGDGLPFTVGFAVAFPDCVVSGSLPPNMRPELLLDANRIADLDESVRRVFDGFRRPYHRKLTERDVEAVREALYPKYKLLPVVWRKVEDQEEKLRRLTAEQERILEILANHPKAAIRGVAGSGKTILALAKAQSLARDGVRTLLLCYNRPLKDWLVEAVPASFANDLVIDTYHGLVKKLCRRAGMNLQEMGEEGNQQFWLDDAPEDLMQACDRLGPEFKFDAVVVDEGQDFHDLWWTSLDAVFRDPDKKTCYYVFYDPKQNLFVEEPSLPDELGPPYELRENCRNTVRIAEHCASLVGYENQSRNGAPQGETPEVERVQSLADAFREVGKRVRQLCMPNLGGLQMSQVAVLAPGRTEPHWPAHFETIPLTKNFEQWRRGECVLIASWRRFKGLEADAIIIIDSPAKDDTRLTAERYVARSRAKHMLTIIEVGKQDKTT